MRAKGSEEYEDLAKECNSLAELRNAAQKHPNFKAESLDSHAPVKILLADLFRRLEIKGKKFDVGVAASEADIETMWETVTEIEPLVDPKEKIAKQSLSSKPSLSGFLEHFCRQRHYFFEIRKCGSTSCATCKPVRLPEDSFSRL